MVQRFVNYNSTYRLLLLKFPDVKTAFSNFSIDLELFRKLYFLGECGLFIIALGRGNIIWCYNT